MKTLIICLLLIILVAMQRGWIDLAKMSPKD